jgi:transcriptional regulator with XRE-family HTH domain
MVAAEVVRLLREVRIKKGLSMTRVGEIAGLSQQMVSYVERGMRIPTIDTLVRLTNALDLDLWKVIRTAENRPSVR